MRTKRYLRLQVTARKSGRRFIKDWKHKGKYVVIEKNKTISPMETLDEAEFYLTELHCT